MNSKIAVIVLFSLFFSFNIHAQKKIKPFLKDANRFFSAFVDSGRVDYLYLRKNPQEVKDLVLQISQIDLSKSSSKKRKAFYINSYNIFLIHNIISQFPSYSPLEEKGLFSEKRNYIDGGLRTLNDLERMLFEKFKDIRIYAALSSGTEGTSSVSNFAYMPSRINRQLKKKIKEVVNNPDFIRVRSKASLILFCESFKTCRRYFNDKEMIQYINRFRKDKLPSNFTLGFYPGKRSLNVKKN